MCGYTAFTVNLRLYCGYTVFIRYLHRSYTDFIRILYVTLSYTDLTRFTLSYTVLRCDRDFYTMRYRAQCFGGFVTFLIDLRENILEVGKVDQPGTNTYKVLKH